MPTSDDESNVHSQLRKQAESQLEAGTAPATRHWSMGVDALQLLHRLSSNPDTAGDALKLLHELQVHQVELDLQNQEIAANERRLTEDLDLYRGLFDAAPLGYLLVDHQEVIIRGNLAAAELLGVQQDELEGHALDTLLPPGQRPLLRDLLQRVTDSGSGGSCAAKTGTGRQLQFLASIAPGGEHFHLACCELPDAG